MSGVTDNALYALRQILLQQRETMAEHVISSGCKDWSEYCKTTGQIKGIDLALRETADLNRKIEEA